MAGKQAVIRSSGAAWGQGTAVYDGACGKGPLIIDPRIQDWFGSGGT